MVALWGHGTRFVKSATRLERALERRALMSAHWFFAYTQRGADHVLEAGFPRDRITVVHNTFDVEELARLRSSVSFEEESSLRRELELRGSNVCVFIGELDAPKRIPFLLEACSMVARRVPDFVLLVAGDGKERDRVEAWSANHPWLRYLGRAGERDKARLGAVSQILLMPGRVGLVAVDSFALATPIVTTTWPYHAPEIDYLEDGINARIANDNVADFAKAVEELLADRAELDRLRAGCAAAVGRYSLDRMVESFAEGVARALRSSRR
jgi:glycosyltransferase involved in cell wall biosynthesis